MPGRKMTPICALQSPASLVILDNIERLVEYVPIGPRFSNSLLQIILELLEKQPPKGRKLMIVGTSSDAEVMKNLGIAKAFTVVVNVPPLSEDEIRQVFLELRAFHPQEVGLQPKYIPLVSFPFVKQHDFYDVVLLYIFSFDLP